MLYSFRKTGKAALLGAMVLLPTYAMSQDTDDLQKKVDELQQQVDALKSAIEKNSSEFVRAAPGGGFQVGATTVRLSGYIKADAAYSDNGFTGNGTSKAYEIVTPAVLKTLDPNRGDRFSLSARQTRFGIGTSTPVAGKSLNTFLSWDFYGDHDSANEVVSNGYGPRLREAYGSYGNWLFGQTWSTFADLNAIGELISFGQHSSVVPNRQTQVRYTRPFEGGMWQFSAENPENNANDQQDAPDLVARLTLRGKWGHFSVGTLARKVVLDDGVDRDSKWTDSYSITGRFPTVGKDDIRLQINYGNLGRYMGLAAYPDAVIGGGNIDSVDAWGASVAYRHFWTEKLRSSAIYSTTKIVDAEKYAGTTTTRYDSAFVNLMWSPIPRTTFGVEYQYYDLKVASGAEHDLTRIAMSAQFDF